MQCSVVLQLYNWLNAILAHTQNPQNPAALADAYLQISLMVIDNQNVSHLGWHLRSFAFSITGAVSVPIFGGPLAPRLVVTLQSLITPNHI